MGVGGGFIMVPMMVYLLRMPAHVAVGTDLFQILFTCAGATIMQATTNHTVDLVLALFLATGSTIGAQIGARLSRLLRGEQLMIILGDFGACGHAEDGHQRHPLPGQPAERGWHARRPETSSRLRGCAPVAVEEIDHMGMTRNRDVAALGFLLTVLTIAIPGTAAAQVSALSVKVSPEAIQMGAFYNGAKMRIEGTAPSGSQVLVVIRGEEHDELFNKKGRAGPIWVNTDRIHVAFTPSLFLSFSSTDVTALLDPTSIEAYQLDEQAIKNRLACRSHCKCDTTVRHHTRSGAIAQCAGVEPDPRYRELIRSYYLALKTREGRYQTHSDAVRMTNAVLNATADDSRYSLDFDWPRSAPPGSYQVEVYACKNRLVVGSNDGAAPSR